MIELKPYRSTITAPQDKTKKVRVGGQIQTGDEASQLWYQGPVDAMSSCAFIGVIGIGMFILLGYFYGFTSFESNSEWILENSEIASCVLPLIIAVTFGVLAVIASYISKRYWKHHYAGYMRHGTLMISDEHLHRGEEFEILFRQSLMKDITLTQSRIEVLTREIVTPSRSWIAKKEVPDIVYDVVVKTDLVFDAIVSPDRLYEHRLTWAIPSNAMHSFALRDNSLTWLIRVTLTFKDFMSLTETYAIQVTPEVHTL